MNVWLLKDSPPPPTSRVPLVYPPSPSDGGRKDIQPITHPPFCEPSLFGWKFGLFYYQKPCRQETNCDYQKLRGPNADPHPASRSPMAEGWEDLQPGSLPPNHNKKGQ